MALAYLIRFSDDETRKQAIQVLLKVPVSRQVLTEGRMVVFDEHIRALNEAGVSFEFLSRPPDGQTQGEAERPASIRS